jgi:Ni/Co efflux regulator RcnB
MNNWYRKFSDNRPWGSKMLLAIVIAAAATGLALAPAQADERNSHDRWQSQNYNGQNDQHDSHGWRRYRHDGNNDARGWNDRHGNYRQPEWRGDRRGYRYRSQYRQPYSYAQPLYVPPPVYYEPRQSPGISFFFPLDLRR